MRREMFHPEVLFRATAVGTWVYGDPRVLAALVCLMLSCGCVFRRSFRHP